MRSLRWQIGFDTDLGGGRENQDDCFVWTSVSDGICVICVLDGHGREVGKAASNAAKISLQNYFEEHHKELKTTPYKCLVTAHEVAHSAIKSIFRKETENEGCDVLESTEGYLLKSKKGLQQWSCIHGGSTCSICAIVDGLLYTANVGDSSGLLCCSLPVLRNSDTSIEGDAAVSDVSRKRYSASVATDDNNLKSKKRTNLVLTADHSPESLYEFQRLRDFRPRVDCTAHPSLNIVYDTVTNEKTKCPSVFTLDKCNHPVLNNSGSYYKNVRKEWASLVSAPSTASFPDALAFTRSLGDLHLQTYGVSHLPEVQCVNLLPIFSSLSQLMNSSNKKLTGCLPSHGSSSGETETEADKDAQCISITPPAIPMLCIVLATDGVWDNWAYDDLSDFVVDSSCLNAVTAGADGAHRVALSLMQRNCMFSKKNFGHQADNATCIVMYLSQSELFPSDFERVNVVTPPDVKVKGQAKP